MLRNKYIKQLDDQDLIEVAVTAYCRKNKKAGVNLIQPGQQASSVTGIYVYLRSGNMLLARYNHKKRRFTELTPEIIKKYSMER